MHQVRTPLRLLTAAIGLGVIAAACGSGASSDASSGGAGTTEPSAESASVTVDHALGTTEVPCTPEKVVTLGQGQTDSTLALGVTPVGVVEPWADDWYDYLPAEVEEAQVVGTELEPDLEAIVALQPDVILGSKLRHEAFYDQLSQIAPTVFSETIGVAWKDNVSLWAEALCREDEGEEILAAYESRAAELNEKLGDAANSEVSMVRFMPDQVRIYLTGFPGSVLRDVGLRRPAAQQVDNWDESPQLIEISEERIPEMDGDVIFVMVSGDAYAQERGYDLDETVKQWTTTDLWKGLSAVQAGSVQEVNEDHWNLGGGILSANALLGDLESYFLGGE